MVLFSFIQRQHGKDGPSLPVVLPLCVIAGLILFTVIFFSFATVWGSHFQSADEIKCLPNGQVLFPQESEAGDVSGYSSTWNSEQFLSINLGLGSFSFAQAKAIDTAWDLFVGRGGQVVLTITTYSIIRRSLLRVVETRGTTFPVFAALAFDKISLSSVAALASQRAWRIQSGSGPSLASRSLWRSLNKLYWAWNWRFSLFLPTFAYVLSFPTWLSVMTGYQAQLTPYVGINGNLELATVLKVPDAVILDGSRIGLFDDYSIFEDQQPELYQLISNYSAECSRIVENTDSQYSNLTKPLTISNVSTADFQFSFTVPPHANDTTIDNPYLPGSSINLTSSISFNNETWTLKAPTLNIVANSSYYGYPSEYYAIDNHAYWADNLTITCEPAKRYQWGFSSQLLFTFCVLTIVFATALTSLHLDAYWGGRSDGHTRPTNIYRDALDLAQELRKQLGVEVEEMSADELRELVNKRQGVIRLETDSLPLSRSQGRAAERRAITGSGRVPTGFRSLMGRRDSSVNPLRRHSTKLQVHYEELELQHDKGIEIHPFDGT